MRKLLYRMLFLLLPLAGPALAQRPMARPLPPAPDSLQRLLRTPGTPATYLKALLRVAEAYSTHSDTARTLCYARAAARLARKLHDPSALGQALLKQGYTYYQVGQLPQAERLAEQALPLVAGQAGGVDAQRLLAQTYSRQNRPAAALAIYRAAYRAAAARHDAVSRLSIDNSRGSLFSGNEQLDSAEFYYVRAARAARQLSAKLPSKREIEAAAFSNLASLNLKRKRYAEASRYARQSIALKLAISDSSKLGITYGTLYLMASATDSLPQALRYVRQEMRLARRFHQLDGVQVCLNHLGNTFAKLSQPDSAEAYFRQAVALARQGGQPVRRGASLNALAKFYDKQHRPAEAQRTALEVEALDSLYRSPTIAIANLKLLAQLAQARHDEAAALGYFQRQRALELRLAAASSSKEIAALRVGFDTERTEQQLALATARAATEAQRATALHLLGQQQTAAYHDTLSHRQRLLLTQQLVAAQQTSRAAQAGQQVQALRQQGQVQTQQARLQAQAARLGAQQQELATLRARQQALGVAVLAVLALVGGGLWFGRYRLRQAAARAIDAAKLRTRLAADLHDDVGNLLTQISMQSSLLRENPLLPAPLLARVDALTGTARRAIQQMSDAIWGLAATAPTLPELLHHMRDHAHQVLQPLGLEPRFATHPAVPALPLSAEARQALYLIFKEALHNIVKHARPSEVVITLAPAPGHGLALTVCNDGPAAPRPARPEGQGLANMQARAAAVGGRVQFPVQAVGFVVEAVV